MSGEPWKPRQLTTARPQRAAHPEGEARPRAWQRMLSGRRLDLLAPDPADIGLDDIAHGLARVARWNGQTRGPHVFSVAQHSLFVAEIAAELEPGLTRTDELAILLHDAAEYVIGDLITPLKAVVGAAYRDVEAGLLAAVHMRFGLPVPPAPLQHLIKRADRVAAALEAVALAGFSPDEARAVFGRPEIQPRCAARCLEPWPTDQAGAAFRLRALALGAAADAVACASGSERG